MTLVAQKGERSMDQEKAVNIIYPTSHLVLQHLCVQAGTSVSGWGDEQTAEEPDHQVRRAVVNGTC